MKLKNTEEFDFTKEQLITMLKNRKGNKRWSKEKVIELLKAKEAEDGTVVKST